MALIAMASIDAGSALADSTTLCKSNTVSPYCEAGDGDSAHTALEATASNFTVTTSILTISCSTSSLLEETTAAVGEPLVQGVPGVFRRLKRHPGSRKRQRWGTATLHTLRQTPQLRIRRSQHGIRRNPETANTGDQSSACGKRRHFVSELRRIHRCLHGEHASAGLRRDCSAGTHAALQSSRISVLGGQHPPGRHELLGDRLGIHDQSLYHDITCEAASLGAETQARGKIRCRWRSAHSRPAAASGWGSAIARSS
jgi:hypothetical protein